MQSIGVIKAHPLRGFEGNAHHSGRHPRIFAALSNASACVQAKVGYIISHQNRGSGWADFRNGLEAA